MTAMHTIWWLQILMSRQICKYRIYEDYIALYSFLQFAAFDQMIYIKISAHDYHQISNKFCCQFSKSFCIR